MKSATLLICFFLIAVFIPSCAKRRISENRIEKNIFKINAIANYMISNNLQAINIDTLENITIKGYSKDIRVNEISVYTTDMNYLSLVKSVKDTIITLQRKKRLFVDKCETILIDRSTNAITPEREKELKDLFFKKVKENIYYDNHIYGPM